MKRLIVCCDGTWNSADQESEGKPCPTNIIKLAYRLAKRDGDVLQVLYYDQGVGTGNWVDKYVGGAVGKGLDDNIFDAYRFLIANYEVGDEIYLFGFSRGAYTARSIGGMLRKCGVIRRETIDQYRPALDLYLNEDVATDSAQAKEFRSKYALADETSIQCIGVFDTVGALGIPLRGVRALSKGKYEFHDTELSGSVKYAFHALAIDEQRAPFQPTLWSDEAKPGQTVEQVWFAGVHSDIGGGYGEHELSDIALDWMIGRAKVAGLKFEASVLAARPVDATQFNGKIHDSKTGVYNLQRAFHRPIGLAVRNDRDPKKRITAEANQPDPRQTVHPSVLKRWDADPKYRPPQLREYLKRQGDPRGQRP